MDRFTLSANTLSKTVKDNPADRIEVEIGDAKQLDFKPQFKIKRWDNEVNFSIRAQEEAGATMVEEDGKVKYKGRNVEVHQYEKPDASEDGGYEFEWVLNKKPESNVLRTTIQHKGLDFFYQPALTKKQIKQGAFRDENVIGSYAVYHKIKKNNIVGGTEYKTGKAFHIYRPYAVDAKGVKVWCDLNITKSELTVTVPEDFLNKASYPVVVDPTFGYTSVGGTAFGGNTSGDRFGNVYSNPTSDINISELSVYLVKSSGTQSITTEVADKDSTSTGETNDSQIVSQTVDFTASGWKDFSYTFNALEDYVIMGVDPAYFSGVTGRYDTVADADDGYLTYGSSDDWRFLGIDRQYSIYATYTAAASYNPAFAHRRLLL